MYVCTYVCMSLCVRACARARVCVFYLYSKLPLVLKDSPKIASRQILLIWRKLWTTTVPAFISFLFRPLTNRIAKWLYTPRPDSLKRAPNIHRRTVTERALNCKLTRKTYYLPSAAGHVAANAREEIHFSIWVCACMLTSLFFSRLAYSRCLSDNK